MHVVSTVVVIPTVAAVHVSQLVGHATNSHSTVYCIKNTRFQRDFQNIMFKKLQITHTHTHTHTHTRYRPHAVTHTCFGSRTVAVPKPDIALHDTPSQSYGTSLVCEITQCYLPPDTSERTPPNPSHAGWYSIYLPRRDRRLI